jgi:uncharacterized membrane protein YccC
VEWHDLILAVAALLSALAGLLAGWAALKRTRASTEADAEKECLQRIREAWEDAEATALKLHQERLRHWDDEAPS